MIHGMWRLYDRVWKARNRALQCIDGHRAKEIRKTMRQFYANLHRYVAQEDLGLFYRAKEDMLAQSVETVRYWVMKVEVAMKQAGGKLEGMRDIAEYFGREEPDSGAEGGSERERSDSEKTLMAAEPSTANSRDYKESSDDTQDDWAQRCILNLEVGGNRD